MGQGCSVNHAVIKTIDRLSASIPEWEEVLLNDAPVSVTFCNPYSVHCLRKFPDMEGLLSCFSYVFADGMLFVKAAHLLGRNSVARLSFDGNSVASTIWDICNKHGLRVALVGGVDGIADGAAEVLRQRGVNVVLTHSGFFKSPEARQELMAKIRDSSVKVTIVGMGAPYQERFAIDLVNSKYRGKVFTCGGYLDQMVDANGTLYYPKWVNRLNVRFAYRLYKEPRRLFHRYTIGYMDFYRGTLGACLQRR